MAINVKKKEGESRLAYILIFSRPLVVLLILGVGISLYRMIGISTLPLLWIIISSFLLSFFFFVSTSIGRPLWYLQLLGDLSIVTAIVYFTGGYDSVFSILYFIPLILSTILTGIRGGFLITVAISLFYTGVLIFHFIGYVPYSISENINAQSLFYKGYIHNFSFYIVFLLSSYLVRRLKKETEKVDIMKVTTQEIIESLPEKIFIIDKNKNIVYRNDSTVLIDMDVLKDREEIEIDGKTYKVSITELRNGNLIMFSLRDITEERKREEELKVKEKIAFVGEISSGLAHEIRNPLSALLGCVETFKRVKEKEKKEKLLGLITEEASRMERIIDTFIRYAKLRRPVFGEVNPEIIVKAQADEWIKKGKKLRINTQGTSSDFKLDPELFLMLFKNIMENAFEATDGKGPVEVNLIFQRSNFILEVCDKGKGIPPGISDKIWSPFFSTKKGGVGMGLALVKRIAESHFAKINLESKEGEGTKVSISFPKL